jgi:hypothetical protein
MAGPEIQVRFPDNRNPEMAGQSGVRTVRSFRLNCVEQPLDLSAAAGLAGQGKHQPHLHFRGNLLEVT